MEYFAADYAEFSSVDNGNNNNAVHFTVDDLLVFSKADETMTDAFFESLLVNSGNSSTVTAVDSCNSSVFDYALNLISERFNSNIPFLWKINRALGLGKEKKLRGKIDEVREFEKKIMREKESELRRRSTLESEDLLSSFLRSGQSDEEFVFDVVICFILAGRDTTSAALTWFFWLLSSGD